MEQILEYFNLSPHAGINVVGQPIPLQWQLSLYTALLLGILANGYLVAARTRRRYSISWQRFVASAVIAIVAFPTIYEGAQANLGQPTLVQLALIFASGLGYESVFSGIAGMAGATEKRR